MPLTISALQLDLIGTLTGTAVHGSTPSFPISLAWAAPLVSGVGLNQADKIYGAAGIVLGPSAGLDIDLAGALTDPFGLAVVMVKLKAIALRAAVGNTNNVNINRPATNGVPWLTAVSAGIPLGPGGIFLFVNPGLAGIATVTPATGDIFRLDNSGAGTSVTVDLVLIGTSA
jgi:hypothetical protein